MSMNLASLGSICGSGPLDNLTANDMKGMAEPQKIKQVSKAMESIFAGQLMSELGTSIDGKKDGMGGDYQDFIQQAMAQGMTSGRGLGLAKSIEDYLTRSNHAPKTDTGTATSQDHVTHAQ